MRTVFLGTSQFAATVLERLAGRGERPKLVVTRPDRPSGRGRRISPPPVAVAARALGLELAQPQDVNAQPARALIAAAAPDTVCVCAFGALIREPLLSEQELINVHPSLLPRWRGAAPIERAIMAGDAQTGVAIMRLTAGLDSGPVAATVVEAIGERDTYGSLSARLAPAGADLLLQTLHERPRFVEQQQAGATYAEKLGPGDRLLDPARPAVELDRVVRALEPHIGARLQLGDAAPLRVRAARPLEPAPGLAAGVLRGRDGRLLLGCGEGTLELLQVQPAGGRPMDAAAYLRGRGPLA